MRFCSIDDRSLSFKVGLLDPLSDTPTKNFVGAAFRFSYPCSEISIGGKELEFRIKTSFENFPFLKDESIK